jgi:hypothetical protein
MFRTCDVLIGKACTCEYIPWITLSFRLYDPPPGQGQRHYSLSQKESSSEKERFQVTGCLPLLLPGNFQCYDREGEVFLSFNYFFDDFGEGFYIK